MSGAAGPIIGAVGSVAGGILSSRGSRDAAESVSEASEASAQAALEQYYQTREDFAPWRAAGQAALQQQMALLGLAMPRLQNPLYGTPRPVYDPPSTRLDGDLIAPGFLGVTAFGMPGVSRGDLRRYLTTGGLASTDTGNYDQLYQERLREWQLAQEDPYYGTGTTYDNETGQPVDPTEMLRATPGYQFQLEEGTKALDRSAAARGMLMSGAQLRRLQEYGQGLADSTFGDYFNRLGVIAGTGQSANQSLANFGAQAVNQAGQFGLVGAQAQATNAINQANIGTNLLNNFADLYAMRQFNQPNSGLNRSFSYGSQYPGLQYQGYA